MAHDVKKNEKGEVTDVQLDEKILPGDPRWGVHNPEVGERDTLSVHDEDVAEKTEAVQVDVPQEEPPAGSDLPRIEPEDAEPSKSSSKSDDDS